MVEASMPIVLAEHVDGAGIRWEARIAADRGRLQVVAVVQPSDTVTTIERLSDSALQQLLAGAPAHGDAEWTCRECSTVNPSARRWCVTCSGSGSAA
jgi:hypothetical protein